MFIASHVRRPPHPTQQSPQVAGFHSTLTGWF
jgi:hypothetical protein